MQLSNRMLGIIPPSPDQNWSSKSADNDSNVI